MLVILSAANEIGFFGANMSGNDTFVFCPYDGIELQANSSSNAQEKRCPRCGFVDYGNPKACVAILIMRGRKLLLAKRAIEPQKGMWDFPGGFVDRAETAEETVVREAQEELQVSVEVQRYLGSVPDVYGPRGTPTLNLCFTAKIIAGKPAPASDVAELRWFPMDELPKRMAFAHQHVMVSWCRRRAKRTPRTLLPSRSR